MIKIAEVLLRTHEHEEFNAGMVYQVSKAYEKSDIIFFGHSKYINNIQGIWGGDGRITFVRIDHQMDNGGVEDCLDFICEYGDNRSKTIVCTVNSNVLNKLSILMRANNEIEIYVCGHGDIECLTMRRELFCEPGYLFSLNPRTIAHVVKDCLIQMKTYRQRKSNREKNIDSWTEFCKSDKSHLLLFSEAYKKYGEKEYEDIVFNRAEFIHLPYVQRPIDTENADKSRVRIGCTPRALRERNGNTWRIIKYVLRHAERCNRGFVFSFFVHYHPRWPHVETFGAGDEGNSFNYWRDHNDREHYKAFMEGCDYILIGYGEDMYVLSSSGIMADAIQHETPVLMFQSHCFDDYKHWNIGRRATTIREMGETIISEINSFSHEKMNAYKAELQRCKEMFENHNVNELKGMQLDTSLM